MHLVLPHRLCARVLRAIVALAGAGLVAGAHAQAVEDPPGRVGRVAAVDGDVRTVTSDGSWVSVAANRPLATGDRITTDHAGHATLEFGSSSLRLGPDSDVTVKQLDDLRMRIRFEQGKLALRVRSADILGELGIETDEGLWVPHHVGRFRFDRPGRGGLLAGQASAGDMLLQAPDSSLPVAAGQRAQVWREGAQETTHYHLVAVVDDAFANWVRAQDRQDDADDAAAPRSIAAQAPLAEMTGLRALHRAGRWSEAPGLGPVWTPARTATGWAPLREGAWSFASPWGWTWTDAAAWGFAPSHYGRWLRLQGRWAWTPGRWTTRPVYAPAIVGWVGGAAFAAAGSTAVGWVPLAPGEAVFPGYAVTQKYWNALNVPAGVAALARASLPAGGHPRFQPQGPSTWANRGAPGGVSVSLVADLAGPQPDVALTRRDRARLVALVESAQAVALPPPAPTASQFLPGSAATAVPLPMPPAPPEGREGAAAKR